MLMSDWSADVCSSDLTPVEIDRHDELPKIATHWVSHENRHVLNRSRRAGKGGKKLRLSSNCHAKDVQLSSTGHNSAARLSPYATEQFFMRHALTAALLATTMACLPDTAHAQAMTAEAAADLRADLASLRAKVETLEARERKSTR